MEARSRVYNKNRTQYKIFIRTAHAIEATLGLLGASGDLALFGGSTVALAQALSLDNAAATENFAIAAFVLDRPIVQRL